VVLELRGITKRLGAFSLGPLDLAVRGGEYFVLLGPSGVGKTVLLEMIAGLMRPDAGRIFWDGEDITARPPERRGFGLVYQDCALFPHMHVAANIAYGLRARGVSRAKAAARVRSVAELVGIVDLLDRMPDRLSGGEKQRVALARALVIRPRALLLDEPLSSVDAGLRRELRVRLKRLHADTGATFLHVTHDADEGLFLAERLGVMLDGTLRQVGTPDELFRRPTDVGVAAFLGLRNVLPARCVRPGVCRAGGIEIHAAHADESVSFIWVRPEEIVLSRQPFRSSARNQLACTVRDWEPAGPLLAVRLAAGGIELTAMVTDASFEALAIRRGTRLYCTFKSSAVHCF